MPPLLLSATLLVGCGKDPIERKIEAALKERLLAARGSDEGVVLTDETPRADIPDKPKEGSRLVFVRGASFQAPLEGLKGFTVAADDAGLRVRLDYSLGAVEITDSTGAAAEREFERLRRVGERMWEEFWGGLGGQFANDPDGKKQLERWLATMPAWDVNFARRFDSAMLLHRFALQADTREVGEEPDEIYRDCRLLRVKREMIAAMGGGPQPAAYAVAAGPTVGLRRGVPGPDPEVRTALFGPDGMTIKVIVTGGLPEAAVLEVVNSFRPFAESRSIARRIAAKEGEPVDAALDALSALHLYPSADTAMQFLLRIAPLQPERRELAEGLATWLKASDAKREQILAAAK